MKRIATTRGDFKRQRQLVFSLMKDYRVASLLGRPIEMREIFRRLQAAERNLDKMHRARIGILAGTL